MTSSRRSDGLSLKKWVAAEAERGQPYMTGFSSKNCRTLIERHRHFEILGFSPQAARFDTEAELNSATIFQGFFNSTDNRFSAN
jgi:hypothetical protein